MGSEPEDNPAESRGEGTWIAPGEREAIARELTGSLPCVRCRYDLRGLSVRGQCPECAMPIRATVLSVVDPYAGELQAIYRPRLLAGGVLAWSGGMLGAALCVWGLRAAGLVYGLTGQVIDVSVLGFLAVALIGLSAIGACALVRPHAGLPRRASFGAAVGVAALAGLAAMTWWILVGRDLRAPAPYFEFVTAAWDREVLRLLAGVMMLAAVRGLATNWNMLQARSVLMRTGRMDKQTAPAFYAAILLAMGGDVVRMVVRRSLGVGASESSIPQLMGTVLVAAGSMFLTVGLVSLLIDCLRLRPVILDRPLSLDQLAEPPVKREGSTA